MLIFLWARVPWSPGYSLRMALNFWSYCLCSPVLGSSEYTTTYGLVLFSKFCRWMIQWYTWRYSCFAEVLSGTEMLAWQLYSAHSLTCCPLLSFCPTLHRNQVSGAAYTTVALAGEQLQIWAAEPSHCCRSVLRVRDQQTNLPLKLGDIWIPDAWLPPL